jgi:hypothetical protein
VARGRFTMSNPCGFTAASYQDLADLLCTVQTNILAQTATLIAQVSALNNYVTDSSTGLPEVFDRFDSVDTQIANTHSAVDTTLVAVGTVASDVGEVQTDLDEVNAAVGIAGGGKTDIIDAVQSSGVFDVVIGLIDFAKTGGGTLQMALVQWLISLWNSPPLALLTASSTHLLGLTNSIAVSTGTYGYVLDLTVPGYWGQRSSTPVLYQPPIGYVAWRGPFGTVGEPQSILTPEVQLYPVPTGATELQVQLLAGITGDYRELRFL